MAWVRREKNTSYRAVEKVLGSGIGCVFRTLEQKSANFFLNTHMVDILGFGDCVSRGRMKAIM